MQTLDQLKEKLELGSNLDLSNKKDKSKLNQFITEGLKREKIYLSKGNGDLSFYDYINAHQLVLTVATMIITDEGIGGFKVSGNYLYVLNNIGNIRELKR